MSREHTCLLVVDVQPDFMPGGGLAVEGGDEIVGPLGTLMRNGEFGVIVATQDWHPAGHVSFASSHDGKQPMETIELHGHGQILWPDHCVQGTEKAELHDGLPLEHLDAIVRKGTDPTVDSYSGFRDNWNADGERPATGLAGYLRERGVHALVVVGLM
jgi:nicotinamidase/pyrazinamidase